MAGSEGEARPSVPLQWPLVERHDELEQFAATLADPRAHGFVIHGPAGVGKTRLADQCLAAAAAAGRAVARATASEAAGAVPLGALAHLLPPGLGDRRSDLVAVVAEVRAVLEDNDEPLVLFVDDLQLLDPTSATLLAQLVDADLVFLVGTVRAGEPLPRVLDGLWQRARVRRVDLPDLTAAGLDTLLHLVLQGPVEASTINEIATRSEGNVLFVRELVLGALDQGHLVEQHGVWRLVQPLTATPRLVEVVAARLGGLDRVTLDALEAIAVWEPVSISVLESALDARALETLDRLGFLTMRTDGRRRRVSLAHPLYGEIVRERTPALTRRRLLLEKADRIDANGARRREDPITVANARLEATGSADPRLLLSAARLARYGQDAHQVARLGRAALADGITSEGGLLVGEACHELARYEEAEAVLSAAVDGTADDDELFVPLVEMRSRNLMWGLFRHEDAIAVNDDARSRLDDGPGAVRLDLNKAMLLTYTDRPVEGLALLAQVGEVEPPAARALRSVSEVTALAATGRCETAARLAVAAYKAYVDLPEQVAMPGPGVHVLHRMHALAECGRIEDSARLAASGYEGTQANSPPIWQMWCAYHQGRSALLAGRVQTARRWLAEALARCEEHDIVGPRRLVLSALATAAALGGDAQASRTACQHLDRLPPFPYWAAEQERGRAWCLVAEGDAAGARRVLADAADHAAATGHRSVEGLLLHDIARLGEARSVAARLADVAAGCEGRMVAAYAAHADAAARADGSALVGAVERFEEMGLLLPAAEAATDAARAFRRAGEQRSATALGVRADALAAQCEGATSPALADPVSVVPLTAREREIAVLAARGVASREIAEQLYLSVRTVNNHLQNAYAKLGVSSRKELAAALDDN